jgi:hypothetical protein
VKRCAAADLRSVNAEIEILLREALERRGIRIRPADDDGSAAPALKDQEDV